ncbi:HAD family hydrolase [Shewanella maritima]|uniref:HAD family hydrolase n=1 Tax=Shewanella maritima TaxID=2520507 RepID=A0A411PDA2_9GAMM|nr:HAD-IA family hydrolase [Shewanella maritima]QBF81488.1 HAD family hydrolase [Shewanella maritima]
MTKDSKKYQLVIFDWDGTLMDTITKIVVCMQDVAKQMGQPVPSEQQVRDIIGLSLPTVMPILFPNAIDKQEELVECYRQQYKSCTIDTPMFEGAVELIEQLYDEGYTLAVATGKARPGLDRMLVTTGLGKYFKATRSASDAASKPDPQMLNSLLKELNVSAIDAVMVGDSIIDMTMASNAEMDAIGVSYGAHSEAKLLSANPVAVVNTPSDIKGLL